MSGYTYKRAESDEEIWQTEMRSIRERNQRMFNNELMSDVYFIVGKTEKMKIPAHKYVMGIGSPVFYAMFYGRMAEKGCEIKKSRLRNEQLYGTFEVYLLRRSQN